MKWAAQLVSGVMLALGLGVVSQAAQAVQAVLTVVDDAGRVVTLARPAQRIVALAPHTTEMLYAAGGAGRVVGVMNRSDYPAAARSLPVIGSNSQIDFERLLALKPDLIVLWHSGTPTRQLAQLERLGVAVFHSEPKRLDQVADSMLRLGRLMGTDRVAQQAARDYRASIATLAARYRKRPQVSVFYQVWDQPVYTLNDQQIVSDAIRLCGGRNVFGSLATLAPEVGVESVLAADPEVIVAEARSQPAYPIWRMWQTQRGMTAVQRGNMGTIDGDLLSRPGPRTAQGAAQLCQVIEAARARRK